MSNFLPTREAGLSRLRAFVPQAARYGEERNFDRVGKPTVSQLSPWLQRRLITEEETCAAVRAAHPWPEPQAFVQEICWRTYWKGWLEHRPFVWDRYVESLDRWRATPPVGYREAVLGQAGIPGFDDWAQELRRTGWLHNHARMWFASIWIFTLRLPWELGADFFWRHLLDSDPASNTLSWRWVAGLHTPGKTYLARADNIARYTEGRFNPVGLLATDAPPVTEPPWPEPTPLWTADSGLGEPEPPVGLWLHPEDLCVETAPLERVTPVSILALWPETLASGLRWEDPVLEFTQAALADGASRAALCWDADFHAVRTHDAGSAVVEWARSAGLKSVIAMRPSVGPWLTLGSQVEARLAQAGIPLRWYRREWDTSLYPAARRGFFPFWDAAAKRFSPVA